MFPAAMPPAPPTVITVCNDPRSTHSLHVDTEKVKPGFCYANTTGVPEAVLRVKHSAKVTTRDVFEATAKIEPGSYRLVSGTRITVYVR